MGRIPILLNTDCRLPIENSVDWNKHVLIIKEKESKNIAKKVLEFHEGFTDSEFLEIQKSNRLLWENTLRRHEYFIAIHNGFINNSIEHV